MSFLFSIELTIEQCEESDHPVGIDITNTITKLTVGSRNIWIIARVTEPNPFKSETPTWKFHDDSLPHGIELLGSKIKITTVLQSKEQEGNYTVRIGDYEAFFTLLVQGENQHLMGLKLMCPSNQSAMCYNIACYNYN